MKLKNYLFAALALGLMSGCSEKDIISNETDGNKTESDNKAYLSVKIALPTGSSATRTVNHKFDNGEAEEYQVNDVTLLFFAKGNATTEDDYVLRNIASTLESINTVENGLKFPDEAWNNVHESGGEITVTSVQTEVIGVAEDVCAVAALINISSEIKIAKEDLRIGKTFKDINSALELLVKDAANNDAGFIMTSSPMLDSGSGVASNFAKCDPKTTEQAAKENPATVKVERIVSKVALLESEPVSSDFFVTSIESLRNIQYTGGWYKVGTADSYSMAYKIGEGVHVGDIISIEGWTLDVTNKTSFPFRKVDVATWIADYPTVWELISSNSRMYFAIDPNYDGTKPDGSAYTTATDFNLIDTNADFGVPGEGHPQYCLENTFDINHQTKDQTTRLIVKAKYYPVNNAANSADTDGTWYALNQKTAHYSADVLKEQIFAIGKSENVFDASLNYDDVTIDLTTTDAKTEVKSVVVPGGTLSDLQLAKLNSHLKITRYDKGYCYYPVRIRHFTDIELYGKAWVYIQPYTPNDLGRYGVVRNTSYQVQIKTISKPGDPEIPTTPNEPDDDDESYITCKIEILAWALRPIQDENL